MYDFLPSEILFSFILQLIFGRQFLIPNDAKLDNKTFPNLTDIPFSNEAPFKNHTPYFYVPIFTLVEFFCYFGWIKVAETLLNPFGNDDEDFKINYLIDRNLQVCTFKNIFLKKLLYHCTGLIKKFHSLSNCSQLLKLFSIMGKNS